MTCPDESQSSLSYLQVESRLRMSGFAVDLSGPNDRGEYIVTTWKASKLGPTGVGTTPELAINAAWTTYTGNSRSYD